MASGHFFAHARLGDARGALTAEDGRYGKTTSDSTPVLKTSMDKVDLFKHKGVKISTEYDGEGKVWRITYHQKDLSETLMAELMTRNAGERKWSEPVKYRGAKHWVTEDKHYHAVYYGSPEYNFIIMTAEATKAERHKRTLEGKTDEDPEETSEEDPETGEPKKVIDPLEGF